MFIVLACICGTAVNSRQGILLLLQAANFLVEPVDKSGARSALAVYTAWKRECKGQEAPLRDLNRPVALRIQAFTSLFGLQAILARLSACTLDLLCVTTVATVRDVS